MRRLYPEPDGEFDPRYRRPPFAPDPGTAGRFREEEAETLAKVRSRPGRPAAMRHFEEVVAGDLRREELRREARPVVGLFCNFAPEELVAAAGAVPVRLCSGSRVAAEPAEECLPRDVCPLAKSDFGAAAGRLGAAEAVRAVVMPVPCDAKRRLAETLADTVPVLPVSLTARQDHRTELPYWTAELERLAGRLEALTGRPIARPALEAEIRVRRERDAAFRGLDAFRRRRPHLLSGSDAALVAAASFTDEPRRFAAAVLALVAELEDRARAAPAPPPGFLPVVLTGAPVLWPSWKVFHVLEDAGAAVVGDTLCSGTQRLYDPLEVDDWSRAGMLRALALRSFAAPVCPCFLDSSALTDRLLDLVAERGARGVVGHDLRLCQPTEMAGARLRPLLRERGIPYLGLHTDLGPEDVEQVRTRVEAFLEMVRAAPPRAAGAAR